MFDLITNPNLQEEWDRKREGSDTLNVCDDCGRGDTLLTVRSNWFLLCDDCALRAHVLYNKTGARA